MSTTRGTIITICAAWLAVLLFEMSGVGTKSTPVSAAPTAEDKLSPETVAAFQRALQDSLRESTDATLKALAAQDEVLARIDANIAEIAQREAAVEEREIAAKALADDEAEKKAEAEREIAAKALADDEAEKQAAAAKMAERTSVIRRSSTIWNVEGNWNYTTEQLATHLQNSHGLSVDGYNREEMKTMHDNIHNGYSAAGGNVTGGGDRNTRSAVQTQTYRYSQPVRYSKPKTQRSGGLLAAPVDLIFGKKSSGDCAGGF